MDLAEASLQSQGQLGLQWVPIHGPHMDLPVVLCLLVQGQPSAGESPFVLLRELTGSSVYLGAVCDAAGRPQEWVEIWLQQAEQKDGAFSSQAKALDNSTLDQRWRAEFERTRASLPESVLVTGMESRNPRPLLIKLSAATTQPAFAKVTAASWRLCTDDDLLKSLGLPAYSSSSHRYLYDPRASAKKALIATTTDAPQNASVQGLDHLLAEGEFETIFNPHAGLMRVTRFIPLELEDYLQILEGRAWSGPVPQMHQPGTTSIYTALSQWSEHRNSAGFFLQTSVSFGQRLDEVFFLKLTVLLELVKAVRSYVEAQQIPLLNLGPASFRVSLPDVADEFPAVWGAKFQLVRPSQAYPLSIQLAKDKYFVRAGRVEPSPFLPEGLGAYSFGTGSIRVRNVVANDQGLVLEGTLIAEDYLGVTEQDLLWFKLPLPQERLEFFANISTSEQVGPKEARFRTIPMVLPDALLRRMKAAAGTAFQRAPYEICPLLSSPCDLYSLGVLGTRILLANSRSNLPVIVDDALSLAQRVAREATDTAGVLAELKALTARDRDVLDRLSPNTLVESGDSPEQARAKLPIELWWETMALLFRFFPGLGPHSFCHTLGEAPNEALEAVFDRPVSELENLVRRLRHILLPGTAANLEIAQLLRDELTAI
jgi:hypothetical protein